MTTEAVAVDGVFETQAGVSASMVPSDVRPEGSSPTHFSAAVQALAAVGAAFAQPDGSPTFTPDEQQLYDELTGACPG